MKKKMSLQCYFGNQRVVTHRNKWLTTKTYWYKGDTTLLRKELKKLCSHGNETQLPIAQALDWEVKISFLVLALTLTNGRIPNKPLILSETQLVIKIWPRGL